MENEMELFRAWLQRYVNKDKVITGAALAKKLKEKGFKSSKATVSSYVSGRLIYGDRKFTKIRLEIRQAISEIVGIPYQQILNEGLKILNPAPFLSTEPQSSQKPEPEPQTEIEKYAEMVESQRARIAELKQQVADLREFKNRLLQENDELKEKLEGP